MLGQHPVFPGRASFSRGSVREEWHWRGRGELPAETAGWRRGQRRTLQSWPPPGHLPAPVESSPHSQLRCAWPPGPALMEPGPEGHLFQGEAPSDEDAGAHSQPQAKAEARLSAPSSPGSLKRCLGGTWIQTPVLDARMRFPNPVGRPPAQRPAAHTLSGRCKHRGRAVSSMGTPEGK